VWSPIRIKLRVESTIVLCSPAAVFDKPLNPRRRPLVAGSLTTHPCNRRGAVVGNDHEVGGTVKGGPDHCYCV